MTILNDEPQVRTAPERARRTDRRGRVDSERATRSRAAQRALDRRNRRVADGGSARTVRTSKPSTIVAGPRVSLVERLRGVPFVVPVIALLVLGLGLSLWLSTKSTQDSYQLSAERRTNQALDDHLDSLRRAYESANSAPELARKAADLGMVPAPNAARMIVDPNRKPRIAGKPTPVAGRPMDDLNRPKAPKPAETVDPRAVEDSIGLGGVGTPTPAPNGGAATPSAVPTAPTAQPTPAPVVPDAPR
ncbi:hypothetical protein QSJ18_11645 [Gordonia sp. ABSL1-1]|uniref:hypothetical protein n=1 Tax=Gordonia sp. ABSL1-1 TaxID=3053923 RepID=UPI0025728B34|nr:hypothetical protein [Gordonia sp. ABSL1-1]MDL9937399.1 hypothetical protein [Gordonia sp. ABSL1-1]